MKRFSQIALLAVLLFGITSAAFAQINPIQLTIHQVQEVPYDTLISGSPTASFSRYLGDTVSVTGTVIAAPRVSQSGPSLFALGNAYTMYIVDDNGGAYSGLNIRGTDTTVAQGTLMTALDTGFVVKVTGVVTQYYTTTQFEIGKITQWNGNVQVEILDTKPRRPNPTDILITDLVTADPKSYSPTAMQWEGVYVALHGLRVGTVTKGSSGRYTWTVTDDNGHSIGVYDQSKYFRAGADAFDPNWAPPASGTAITEIRGIITTSGQGVVIAPIYPGDIKIGSNPPIISNVTRSIVYPKSTEKMVINATIEDTNPDGQIVEAKLTYGLGNGPAIGTLDMTYNATSKAASIELPEQADGSAVWYFIVARDNSNETTLYPSDTSKAKPFYLVHDGTLSIHEVQYTPFSDGNPCCVGATVSVRGVVTSDDSLTITFIQDGVNPWSGVLVRGGSDIRALKVGDDVTVTGKIAEGYSSATNGNTALTEATLVTNHGTAAVPAAVLLQTKTFKTESTPDGTPAAECWEGMLVKFENLTVTNSNADAYQSKFYGEFLVNDGSDGDLRVNDLGAWKNVYTNDTAKKELIFLSAGTRIQSLQGIMMYNFANYKLEPRYVSDFSGVTGIEFNPTLPEQIVLHQSHPNPVAPGATAAIAFEIPKAASVTLDVYDLLGHKVATIVNGHYAAGTYEADFTTGRLTQGLYFYRLSVDGRVMNGRMMIQR
jgi:hypothetical protein